MTDAKQLISWRHVLCLLLSFTMVAAPHTARIPGWAIALMLMLIAWRAYVGYARLSLPNRWLLLAIAVAATFGIFFSYRTIFGRDAGVALLVVMLGLKLLETRSLRDAMLFSFLGYFLMITNFLYSQTIATGLFMLACTVFITATMVSLNYAHSEPPFRAQLRTAAMFLAQSVPLMLILFLLFPRVQGPLWGLPQDAYAGMTGLSETMSPGTLASLAQYDAIAFRAEFEGDAPRHALRYWRGPVLWDFDGRTWSMSANQRGVPLSPRQGGASYRYTVVLEPHNRSWLFALETAVSVPERARMTFDGQILSSAPVRNRLRYELVSVIAPEALRTEAPGALSRATRIPPTSNPRAQALATQWRANARNDEEIVARALEFLRAGRFDYTLEPPLLGLHTVDEFLFDTKSGFCEHFASAFTFLMRAAGVPSRVVTGYQGGDLNPYDRIVTVRQWDAHAWSEVFLSGRGWVRVDPTAAAAPQRVDSGVARAVPENAAMPLMMQPRMEWLREARYRWEAIAHKWNVWVLGYNPERQRDLMQWVGIRDADWRALTAALFSILGVITLALLAWSLRRLARPDPVQKAWRAFCRKLAQRGVERAAHEGPRDYTRRAARSVPDARRTILRIGELYLNLRYGAQTSPPSVARLQRLVRALRVT